MEQLARYGDWEGNTIIGKGHKGAILTLTERKSKVVLAALLPEKTAKAATMAAAQLLRRFPQAWRRTLTLDNGTAFADHERIARETGIKVFFARPYHAWERGRIENVNGLLRQFFPKHTRFDTLDPMTLQRAVDELNNRPRKCLEYKTHMEVLKENGVALEI